MQPNEQPTSANTNPTPENMAPADNNFNNETPNATHKGIKTSYLVIAGAAIVLVIVAAVVAIVCYNKAEERRRNEELIGMANQIIDHATKTTENIDNTVERALDVISGTDKETNTKMHTSAIKSFEGEQSGIAIKSFLDTVINVLEKDPSYPVSVTYGATSTSKIEELTELKDQFDRTAHYEITLNYDSEGRIDKATITNQQQ